MGEAGGKVWDIAERTFIFATRIVPLCRKMGEARGASRMVANQLIRSGTSVGANVEEGQAAQSRADFISKYSVALKEARETNYWLRLIVATELVKPDLLADLCQESLEIKNTLGASVVTARDNA